METTREAHKIEDTPHLLHPILDKRAGESEADPTSNLFESKGDRGTRLLHAMGFVCYDDSGGISRWPVYATYENGISFNCSILFRAVS